MATQNAKLVQVTKDEMDNELVMVRVDTTMSKLMAEQPFSRWDPSYWHPDFQDLVSLMSKKWSIKILGDFIAFITYGQVGKRVLNPRGKVKYLQTINMISTGIDYQIKEALIDPNSHNDPERSRLKYADLLFGNSGMGGLGKVVVFEDKNYDVNISQDIDIIRFNGINQYYVATFLKSVFGNKQVWIRSKGVGAPKIPFDEIKAIKIPILPEAVQKNIEIEYKKMVSAHDKAMSAKQEGDEAGYSKNISIAETMLKDLIARTEAIIRGERDDVV